jgi:hypothetical protein
LHILYQYALLSINFISNILKINQKNKIMPYPQDFQNTDLAAIWTELNNRSSVIIFQNIVSTTALASYVTWTQTNAVLVSNLTYYKDGTIHYFVATYSTAVT